MIKSNKKKKQQNISTIQTIITKDGSTNPAKLKVELFPIVINDFQSSKVVARVRLQYSPTGF